MRLFVAIELPDAIKQEIAKVQEGLRKSGADAGWTRPEGIHLTLSFLGETAGEKVPEITSALMDAAKDRGRFRIEVSGAGAFPHARNPRVLWIGVKGDLDALTLLQASVERAMQGIGFEPEARKFSPHLTLARIKYLRPEFSWQRAIEGIKDAALGAFDVTAVSLMKSELNRSGAVYTEMGRVELKKNGSRGK